MKTVLACVDFSEVTSPVLESAAALCAAMGAKMSLLHVVSYSEGPDVTHTENPEDRARKAQARLDVLAESIRNHGFEVMARVREWVGNPAGAIIAEADRVGADFIVMGSHGHGALYSLLLGSAAEGVIRKAMCPVFMVPSRKVEKRGTFEETSPTRKAVV